MKGGRFEQSLKLPKILLEWAGIQIFPKKNERSFVYLIKSWLFYFNFSWLGPVVLAELYWMIEGVYTGLSFDEICTCVPCFTICILAIVKTNCLFFNRGIVAKVVAKLKAIHPVDDEEQPDVNRESRVLRTATKFVNRVIMISCYLNMVVVVVFSITSLLSMAYDFVNTGSTELKLPFRVKYFFEVYTWSRWPAIYFHQIGASCRDKAFVFLVIIASINLVSTDLLFYTFCTYLQMHFRLLCLQFENVVSNNKAETRQRFRKAVTRHQELIELVEQIEVLYSKSTLCNIILSSLLICLSGFIVTFVHDVSAVSSFVTFLVMSLFQISVLCYFGDILNSASTRVSQAVYNSLWYDADLDIKKNVLIVISRAQKPCKLTAMKFADLNLNALSAILRTSWSYFALLKTMYD